MRLQIPNRLFLKRGTPMIEGTEVQINLIHGFKSSSFACPLKLGRNSFRINKYVTTFEAPLQRLKDADMKRLSASAAAKNLKWLTFTHFTQEQRQTQNQVSPNLSKMFPHALGVGFVRETFYRDCPRHEAFKAASRMTKNTRRPLRVHFIEDLLAVPDMAEFAKSHHKRFKISFEVLLDLWKPGDVERFDLYLETFFGLAKRYQQKVLWKLNAAETPKETLLRLFLVADLCGVSSKVLGEFRISVSPSCFCCGVVQYRDIIQFIHACQVSKQENACKTCPYFARLPVDNPDNIRHLYLRFGDCQTGDSFFEAFPEWPWTGLQVLILDGLLVTYKLQDKLCDILSRTRKLTFLKCCFQQGHDDGAMTRFANSLSRAGNLEFLSVRFESSPSAANLKALHNSIMQLYSLQDLQLDFKEEVDISKLLPWKNGCHFSALFLRLKHITTDGAQKAFADLVVRLSKSRFRSLYLIVPNSYRYLEKAKEALGAPGKVMFFAIEKEGESRFLV